MWFGGVMVNDPHLNVRVPPGIHNDNMVTSRDIQPCFTIRAGRSTILTENLPVPPALMEINMILHCVS